MKIGGFFGLSNNEKSVSGKTKGNSAKTMMQLQAGDRFRATVLDIKRNQITIKLADGNVITAKSLVIPEARIGQDMDFIVQSNKDGQILVSMTEEEPQQQQQNAILNILSEANIMPSEDAVNLLKNLLKNEILIDKNLLESLLRELKNNSSLDMDTLMFMLKENIPINEKNIEITLNTAHNHNNIKNQIEDFAWKLVSINQPDIKESLISLFVGDNIVDEQSFNNFSTKQLATTLSGFQEQIIEEGTDTSKQSEGIRQALENVLSEKGVINAIAEELMNSDNTSSTQNVQNLIDELITKYPEKADFLMLLKNEGQEIFEEFTNKLMAFFEQEKNQILKEPDKTVKAIMKNLFMDIKMSDSSEELNVYYKSLHERLSKAETILKGTQGETLHEALKTVSELKENIEFMNNINKFQEFIQVPFRLGDNQNKCDLYVFNEKKGKKISKDKASVLIALDLKMLGHFEAFIQKDYKNIFCQFRVMEDRVEQILKKNMPVLQAMLKKEGYNLNQVLYKTIKEPFNILKSPEELGIETTEEPKPQKRYSFDMRV